MEQLTERLTIRVSAADLQQIRAEADKLETLTDKSYWPYPAYSDLLYY